MPINFGIQSQTVEGVELGSRIGKRVIDYREGNDILHWRKQAETKSLSHPGVWFWQFAFGSARRESGDDHPT
jgi:hypothetical protein